MSDFFIYLLKILQNYFWSKNAGHLLECMTKETITDKNRRDIIVIIVDFLVEKYGQDVSSLVRTLTAATTIVMFPALRYKNSKDGTVSAALNCTLYNVVDKPNTNGIIIYTGTTYW